MSSLLPGHRNEVFSLPSQRAESMEYRMFFAASAAHNNGTPLPTCPRTGTEGSHGKGRDRSSSLLVYYVHPYNGMLMIKNETSTHLQDGNMDMKIICPDGGRTHPLLMHTGYTTPYVPST